MLAKTRPHNDTVIDVLGRSMIEPHVSSPFLITLSTPKSWIKDFSMDGFLVNWSLFDDQMNLKTHQTLRRIDVENATATSVISEA